MAAERKSRLLRIPPTLDAALERAAKRQLRSVNALVERTLRRAMIESGDLRDPANNGDDNED